MWNINELIEGKIYRTFIRKYCFEMDAFFPKASHYQVHVKYLIKESRSAHG